MHACVLAHQPSPGCIAVMCAQQAWLACPLLGCPWRLGAAGGHGPTPAAGRHPGAPGGSTHCHGVCTLRALHACLCHVCSHRLAADTAARAPPRPGLVALMGAKAFGADSVAITDIKNDKCAPSPSHGRLAAWPATASTATEHRKQQRQAQHRTACQQRCTRRSQLREKNTAS